MYYPLQDYLDSLPNPVTFRDRAVCWWSDFIDNFLVLKMKVQLLVKCI